MKPFIYGLWSVLFLLTNPLQAQSFNNLQEAQALLETYQLQAISSDTSQFTQLLQQFEELAQYFEEKKAYESYAHCLSEISTIEMNLGNSRKMIDRLEAKIGEWKDLEIKEIDPKGLASLYVSLGSACNIEGLYKQALEAFNNAESILNKLTKIDIEKAILYNQKARVLLEQWDTDNARFYTNKAIQLLKNKKDSKIANYLLAICYTSLGDIFSYESRTIESLEQSITYHQKALEISEFFLPQGCLLTGTICNNLGLSYWYLHIKVSDPQRYLKTVERSRYYYDKGLPIIEKYGGQKYAGLGRTQNNLAMTLLSEWWIDINQSLEEVAPELRPLFNAGKYAEIHGHPDWEIAFEKSKEGFELTEKQYLKSLQNKKNCLSPKHPFIMRNYNNLISCYLAGGEYEKALENIKSAFLINLIDTKKLQTIEDYDFKNILSPAQLLNTLKWKSNILKAQIQLEKEEKNKQKIRIDLLNVYAIMMEMVGDLIATYNEKDSQIGQLTRYGWVFEKAIELSNELYEQTNDPNYLNKIFEFSEKSKANLSRLLIRENEALKYIADTIVFQQDSLFRLDKNQAQTLLLQEQQSIEPDKNKVKELKTSIDDIKLKHKNFKSKIEKKYSVFQNIKQDKININAKKIQQSIVANHKNKVLIDFFLGEDNLVVVAITKDTILVEVKVTASKIDTLLSEMRTLIAEKENFINDYDQNFNQFVKVSHQLYEMLLKDILENEAMNAINEIIFIPYQKLSYLPFETLLINQDKIEQKDFGQLNYLLKKYSVHYAYSSTLLERAFEKKKDDVQNQNNYIGFACSQLGDERTQDSQASKGQLKGAVNEVKEAQELLGGLAYLDEEASKQDFQNLKESPKILQLAMHTQLDMKEPLRSKFLFFESDNENDGSLYAYELYNQEHLLKNVDLAVLTSCETGYGPTIKGEGIASLSQTFLHTNCKSILMSLWLVNDETTPKLMQSFFENLKAGQNKPTALREAKLQYLATEKKYNHPYYWASCIVSGNDLPIQFQSFFDYKLLSIGIFILLIMSVLWVFRKKL